MCLCVYREHFVAHDVVDGVQFIFKFVVLQAVGVQSSVYVPYGDVFVLGWAVRGIRDKAVCEGRFPVYGGCPFSSCLVDSDV